MADLGLFCVVSHPIVDDALAVLRDRNSTLLQFRQATDILTPFLVIEATRDLPVKECEIDTPSAKAAVRRVARSVVVVSILRSANAQIFPALNFFPGAHIGYFGVWRDEATGTEDVYKKLPNLKDAFVIVFDPMLATGMPLVRALQVITDGAPAQIVAISIIAAREGVKHVHERFGEVKIVAGALDDELDAEQLIVPGLGDFGRRWHGTA